MNDRDGAMNAHPAGRSRTADATLDPHAQRAIDVWNKLEAGECIAILRRIAIAQPGIFLAHAERQAGR